MSKTFFMHTTKTPPVKEKFVPAASIALKRVGDKFHYGVAICSKYDNFSKKYGREIAESRMNQGFAVMDVPKPLLNLDEKVSCLAQIYNISASLVVKNKKWKKRVAKFNIEQNNGAKIVFLNSENKN